MEFIPSYKNYRKILQDIIDSGKLCDYWGAKEKTEFVVLRHDIEFSVERAYAMSLVESEMGVSSTYFVQIANNAYNAFSQKNRELVADMRNRGHHIGLHYHRCGKTDHDEILDDIKLQLRVLSEMYGFEIDRFAMHRPARESNYNDMHVDEIINAYSKEFFTLIDKIDEDTKLDVKYIADSQHRWNYGYPDSDTIADNKKIQLLIHPDFWSEYGYDARDNFKALIDENNEKYIDTIDGECKHFHQFKSEMMELAVEE